MQFSSSPWWSFLWEFLVHVVIGTSIFIVIAMPAGGLDFLVSWLSSKDINVVIIIGLNVAKFTLFIIDIGLFIVFLIRTAMRTLRNLLDA